MPALYIQTFSLERISIVGFCLPDIIDRGETTCLVRFRFFSKFFRSFFFEKRITVKRGKETRKAPCIAELDKITCEILIVSKLINMRVRSSFMESSAFAYTVKHISDAFNDKRCSLARQGK